MSYVERTIKPLLESLLSRGRSVLLLGPRQTGKTTLLRGLPADLTLSLVEPQVRQRYEREPGLLALEVEKLKKGKSRPRVILDEVQKVPALLDAVQDLIDRGKADFLLTGSSARKLKKGPSVNLLPGRMVPLRLDPFLLREIPNAPLEDLLLYGSLPRVFLEKDKELRERELEAYGVSYLEEEIRAEAMVRNLAAFGRFLEAAAGESGKIVNFLRLSQDIGVAHTTIMGYYEVLEDCLIVERVEPITASSTRRKLTRSNKYLFFDLGVRRACAREGAAPPAEHKGFLFEQWVGLELIRLGRLAKGRPRLRFWRDPGGAEVDWVLEGEKAWHPIEVKWTDAPAAGDARHLRTFQQEYKKAGEGFVICRSPRKMALGPRVTALPWSELGELFQ